MAHAVVLVLGDIGRSPRMQYHALSLAEAEPIKRVTLMGYRGEKVLDQLLENPKVHIKYIVPMENKILQKISILNAIWKGLSLLIAIFFLLLFQIPRYHIILIQNPPSIPAMFVALLCSLFNRSKIILDWHNLGFSIYEQTLGKSHVLVKITYWLEKHIVSRAHYHLCVSQAMQTWLQTSFPISQPVIVFHDKPHRNFQAATQLTLAQRHSLLRKLRLTPQYLFPHLQSQTEPLKGLEEETIGTVCVSGEVQADPRTPRPALVITSTSWTPDEQVDLLLTVGDALDTYLTSLHNQYQHALPVSYDRLVVVITGKGPNKQAFLTAYATKHWQYVTIRTLWLEMEDYPRILACAQCGLSFHTSSSGLDLPMKVVDMLGSGLPVCAISFPTLPELLVDQYNGCYFQSGEELVGLLVELFFQPQASQSLSLQKEKKEKKKGLEELQQGVIETAGSWDEEWTKVMYPIIQQIVLH